MKWIMIVAVVLVGCSDEWLRVENDERRVCADKASARELADFIIKCSEAANPKSDEEGEDLVAQCEETGIRTLCPIITQCRTVRNSGGFMPHTQYGSWGACK